MASIAVVGMWHLGSVTSACLASVGHTVIAIDEDSAAIAMLTQGQPPVNEPGLASMITNECAAGRLRFSTSFEDIASCSIVWIAYDTHVNEDDIANVEFVHQCVLRIHKHVSDGTVIVVSSQMPAGSIARLERECALQAAGRCITFAYAPENLRLGNSIDIFLRPDRVVLGVRDQTTRATLENVYKPFTDRIEWMSVESAEMTKHAINAFLATSICLSNEIAILCKAVGADPAEVEQGVRTDRRIGHSAYVHAGSAVAGGTLARDIAYLRLLGNNYQAKVMLLDGVYRSNEYHKTWHERQITKEIGQLRGRTIALLGLGYKPGTNTLRRSATVELAVWLNKKGAHVRAFDPQIKKLPKELQSVISLGANIVETLRGVDALVILTPWTELYSIDLALMPSIIFDVNSFFGKKLINHSGIKYCALGMKYET